MNCDAGCGLPLALDAAHEMRITAIERAPNTGDMLRLSLCTDCSAHFLANLAGAGDLRVEVEMNVPVAEVLSKFRSTA